ncbi:hypothetical protein BGZ65_009260, partial [Modicella reniformis]
LTKYAIEGAGLVANLLHKSHDGVKKVATNTLSSLHHLADNRARLNRAGIDLDKPFIPQLVTQTHQKEALTNLLRDSVASNRSLDLTEPLDITGGLKGIVLADGRTIWVCDQCHDCLQRKERIEERIEELNNLTISQYIPLVKRNSEVNATLCNPASVLVLTEIFNRPTGTEKMVLRIKSSYFETPERVKGTSLISNADIFMSLGEVLQHQRALTHLEIHGDSKNGEVYSGLQAVLQSRSLETLHVSGIPNFLHGKNLRMRCRHLRELVLQDILVDTEEAADNLQELIGMSSDLTNLTVTRINFTSMSLVTLFLEKAKDLRMERAKIEHLDLDLLNNDLEVQEEVINFMSITRVLQAIVRLKRTLATVTVAQAAAAAAAG